MSKEKSNTGVEKNVSILIDEFLAKQDNTKMEVEQIYNQAVADEETQTNDYIWEKCWDREEYEKGFFKKLM
jgi:hypothetical protein